MIITMNSLPNGNYMDMINKIVVTVIEIEAK